MIVELLDQLSGTNLHEEIRNSACLSLINTIDYIKSMGVGSIEHLDGAIL